MSAFLETIRFNNQAVYNLKPRWINSTSQNLYVGTLNSVFCARSIRTENSSSKLKLNLLVRLSKSCFVRNPLWYGTFFRMAISANLDRYEQNRTDGLFENFSRQ